jgi:DNA-binding protein H-NS
MKKNLQDIREFNMELNEVAADLAKHEAVCAERWKTAFNKFSDIEQQINRIETIMIGVECTLIGGVITTIGTILSMHP